MEKIIYRIDDFLKYYQSLKDSDMEISPGIWVHNRPVSFFYGIFTKEYWKQRKLRKKAAKEILKGRALAVTWENVK